VSAGPGTGELAHGARCVWPLDQAAQSLLWALSTQAWPTSIEGFSEQQAAHLVAI
jgi:hypothetical protein